MIEERRAVASPAWGDVRVFPTAGAVAAAVADELVRQLALRPGLVLGLATGATMVPIYRRLVQRVRDGAVGVADATTFNLDEYVGLPSTAPESYHAYMTRHLFGPLGLSPEQSLLPDGAARDLAHACRAYDEALRVAGGLDLQILGLGLNGHIGFNEPGTPWSSTTHVVTLSEMTRRANARFFGHNWRRVPTRAITLGVANIVAARRVLVVVTGSSKARILRHLFVAPINEDCPATALYGHPALVWFLDKAAASELPGRSLDTPAAGLLDPGRGTS